MAAVIGQAPAAFHRKPVGSYAQAPPPQPSYSPDGQQYARAPSMATNHSPNYSMAQPISTQAPGQSRRTLSNATTSSTASNSGNNMQRIPTGGQYASSIRRSTSSRSNGSASPTSYVALMRKQKATVWCDRAQQQDPRVLAAQRQAKMRAVMEVAGGHAYSQQARASTSSSGGVRSKIRHHGAPKAKDYGSGNLSGAGVPMRLSATEVDEGDSDDDKSYHQRDSRSRSSMSSVGRSYGGYNYKGYDASPPNATSPVESLGDLVEEQTPMPEHFKNQNDYFGQAGGNGNSGSSGEAEQSFGKVGGLPQTTRQRSDSEHLTSDELRRRGSVDDRTMTMGGGRLFVANPDLSD